MDLVNEIKQSIETLNRALKVIPERMEFLEESIKKTSLVELDIIHLMETENFNAYQGYDLSLQMQKNRIERRGYKDEKKFLSGILKTANNNYKLELHTASITNNLNQTANVMENRGYRMRVRDDLQGRIDLASKKQRLRRESKKVKEVSE